MGRAVYPFGTALPVHRTGDTPGVPNDRQGPTISKTSALKVDNGITAKDRKKLAEGLSALLADT